MPAPTALGELKVIDLSHHIAGPYCTKLMAGFGAKVIKVEPPTGDPMRRVGPFHKDVEEAETSLPFQWLNTGKESITLNLELPRGVEILKGLVKDADVLVESFAPSVMASLGLDYETLGELNPRLVMTSISTFGRSGPYRDYEADEMQVQALSGMMQVTGDPQRPPLRTGPAVVQYSGGLHAYAGTLMALLQRGASGRGQHVDVALLDCGLENIEIMLSNYLQLERPARRGPGVMVPWGLYPCRDGYAVVLAMPQRHWRGAAEIFEDPRLFEDRFAHLLDRIKHRTEYEQMLEPCVRAHSREELFEAGQAHKLAFGYLASTDEAIELPPLQPRGFFEETDHPVTGRSRQCGAPFRMSATPWRTDRAPLLGEHNDRVYGDHLHLDDHAIGQMWGEGVI